MKKSLVVLAVLIGLIFSGCVAEDVAKMLVIYVADTSNGRVVLLDSNLDWLGSFQQDWGSDKLTLDADYIYADAGYIRKYMRGSPYTLIDSVTTKSFNDMDSDDDYVYIGITKKVNGDNRHYIQIYDKSDLSLVDEFDTNLDNLFGITVDDTYIYAYEAVRDLVKFKKSDHSEIARVDVYDRDGIYPWFGMDNDSNYLYFTAGELYNGELIAIYKKSDLIQYKVITVAATSYSWDVAVYGDYVYQIDYGDHMVRKVHISTGIVVATFGVEGVGGDDQSHLYYPRGVAVYDQEIDKEAPWKEDILTGIEGTFGGDDWNGGFGIVKVETPAAEGQPARRSGNWVTLTDVMRIHTSNGKDTSVPRAPTEIGQAEVTCSNISKNFNSFEEASAWYKNLEGYAMQIKMGCNIEGSPVSVKLFTGIIKSVYPARLSQTAEIKVIDFLDYFGRVTITETPVWENISLTQLFKNLVELVFPEWVEGIDYFVEDLGGSTIPAIGYTDLNLLSELKMISESRGMRLYTDTDGKLHCASRNPERDPLTVSYNYNLEGDVKERRDIDSILNWIVVHARPHEVAYEPTSEPDVLGPDVTPPGKVAAFTATPGDEKIDLSWLNPTDDDFDKVRICFSVTAYPLNENDGTQIYEGTGESKEHTGLTNGTRYFYSAFTVDTTGNWSGAAHTSAIAGLGADTWVDDMPPSRLSAFRAEPESGKVLLTWRNPDIANFDKVRIRYSTTDYPTDEDDGSAVYEGTAETTTHSSLSNGTRYYYSAFVANTASKWSGPSFASAIPAGLRKILDTELITGYQYDDGKYFSSYSKIVRLTFPTLNKTEGWLRFRHRWDVETDSGPKYPSNEKHEVGLKDDLSLSFSQNFGGAASVTVRKISCTAKELVVDYTLTLTARVLKIKFRNYLSLMG